jgi:hypothetical protein
MAIQFTCPNCGVKMNVDPTYAGQTGPCSKCGEKITIPEVKLTDLPPVGGYGAHSSGSGSSGCVIASLAIVALLTLFLVCAGGFLFSVGRPMRVAAQSAQSNNNMRQIGLALMNYQDIHGSLPPAYVTDAQGNKLYSWRVLILPYIEQAGLYNAFDKEKAWDDPVNRPVSQQIIGVFRSAGDEGALCSYFAVTGKGTAFEGSKAARYSDVTDGLSNTIYIIESQQLGRSWAEPYDIDIDSTPNLIGYAPGQVPGPKGGLISALQMDGSVITLAPSEERFRAMASIRGNEVIDGMGEMQEMKAVAVPIEVAPPPPPVVPAAPTVPDRPPVVDGNDTAPLNNENSAPPKGE